MTGILFGILKLLALILLGILGLILLVVLLVLLVPIRYEAEGSYHGQGTPQADACVSWLLHLIHIRAGFHDHLAIWVRICGFKVFSTEEEKKERKRHKKKRRRKRKKTASVPEPEMQEAKTAEAESEEVNPEKTISEKPIPMPENVIEADHTQEAEPTDIPETEAEDNSEKRSFSFAEFYDKLKSILQRLPKSIYDRIRRICEAVRDKYRMVSEKKQWIKVFLDNEDNRKTLRLLKRQGFRLVRHVFPHRLRGEIRFGFDDPYTTGQILTWISPFYGLYAGKINLIPVFEEKALDGELSLKGRIRLGTILILVVRVLLNKNFRRLLREFQSRD
jgi:predicted DNA-binding protein (MmcQ/YjbR family)